jgi:hypothetical protein
MTTLRATVDYDEVTPATLPRPGVWPSTLEVLDVSESTFACLPQRIQDKIERGDGPDDCWSWTAYLRPDGYGETWDRTIHHGNLVHRVVYGLLVGPIPDGLVIDHVCRNRSCCNPAHLRAVTDRENVVLAPGSLAPSATNAAKTECIHGHARWRLDPKTGYRSCLECLRIRAWNRKRPGQPCPSYRGW